VLKARDIMRSDLTTVNPEMTVEELGRLFIETGRTGLPVTDREGRLLGMVTEDDLVSSNKRLHIPTVLRLFDAFIPLEGSAAIEREIRKLSASTVADIYTSEVVTVAEEAPLDEIATIMSEKHLHHLPVVRDGRLVGIINQHDVIRGIAGEVSDAGA
jgi:CBS domain-containing protein